MAASAKQASPGSAPAWRKPAERLKAAGGARTKSFLRQNEAFPHCESLASSPRRQLSTNSPEEVPDRSQSVADVVEILDDPEEETRQEAKEDDVAVALSDLDSEEEERRLLQLQQRFREQRRRRRHLQRVKPAPTNERASDTYYCEKWMNGSDCVQEIGERCLDMERGIEAYEDFYELNLDEKALWLSLKFIHLYQRCMDKVTTPGTMSRPLRKMKEMVENLFPSNVIGPGTLRLMPGFRCLYTGQLSAVGLHCAFNDRCCIGHDDERLPTVTSLLLNDDRIEDNNDIIVVYGEESDGKGHGAYPGDQMLFIGGTNTRNYSLWNAWKLEYPVRVIRGYKCKSRYAPSFGFRYDGLYRVVEMLVDSSSAPCVVQPRTSPPATPPRTRPSSEKTGSCHRPCDADESPQRDSSSPPAPSSPGARPKCEGEAARSGSAEERCRGEQEEKEEHAEASGEGRLGASSVDAPSEAAASTAVPGRASSAASFRGPQRPAARGAKAEPAGRRASNDSQCPPGASADASSRRRTPRVDRADEGADFSSPFRGVKAEDTDCEPRHSLSLSSLFQSSPAACASANVNPDAVRQACPPDRVGRASAPSDASPQAPDTHSSRVPPGPRDPPEDASPRSRASSPSLSASCASAAQGRKNEAPTANSLPEAPAIRTKAEEDLSPRGDRHSAPRVRASPFQTAEKGFTNNLSRDSSIPGTPPSGAGSAGGNSEWAERKQLDGRRVFKFVLVSIHRDIYLAPETKLPDRDIAAFDYSLFEEDKGLKKVKTLALQQYRTHCKIQEQLQASSAAALTRSTKVVQIWSDLPLPFAVAVPPVLRLPGQTQSILSNFLCIMAAAYKIYSEMKLAADPRATEQPSGALRALQNYHTAVSLSAASSRPGWRRGLASRAAATPLPPWALCGFLPVRIILTQLDLELRELPPASKQRLIARARLDRRRHPPGFLESKRDSALPSFSKTSEEFEELLAQLENKRRLGCRHRPLVWTETRTEILVNAELAKVFSHQLLPQSATCGLFATIELCSPLPDSWSPWRDISQGKERFPIPAVNDVDRSPPPVDFSYQVRNVCFSRLPNFCMLCLCAGCVPRGQDTSDWERIELEGYSLGLRDPKTGRVHCAGSNLAFIRETSTIAVCTSYCLCDKSVCRNRYPEDLAYPVLVAKTKLAGWELRTQVAIPSGAFIMQYVGEIMCRATMDGRSRHNSRRGYHNYCMEIVQDEWDWEDNWKLPCIDSLFIGNASRFLNHSCEPNVEVRNIWRGPLLPVVGVFARRAIRAGEALTYAYGAGYETIKCWCGAKACKGYIGGDPGSADREGGKKEENPREKAREAEADGAATETDDDVVEVFLPLDADSERTGRSGADGRRTQ
ncbi:histone lysine methyltransferase SET/SUV39 [Besnoitia besnoiti]|uniref:Histone lysine methyltransferase SET/SUV39 n=1 Tax=Besnoitia besnoiti TaxID=94643 RepID=A0A2A9M8D9_BESBE|nr:histone lysine methyltransferase SET/SUV39 [Besnoitia besnoiti]PFH33434.1 histone lysine methyltransferase SET/SUV39 [Besnoitia besnoiti]